jgi:phage recombination protein Bet
VTGRIDAGFTGMARGLNYESIYKAEGQKKEGGGEIMEEQKAYEVAKRDEFHISMADVKKFIAPNATDKELFMFMGIAKSYGLNPMKREIHFVKYGTNPASIIVGYETYLKRAERTGKLDGWKCWIEKDEIGEKAVIEIKRKDQSMPIKWEVYRKEFDKAQSTWKSMPTFMLKKVAIAQGFRMAFPDDLGGMPYIPEEMPKEMGGGQSEALPTDSQEDIAGPEIIEEEPTVKIISEAQQKRLFAKAKEAGWKTIELKNYLQNEYGISSSRDIPAGIYDTIIEWVESHTGYEVAA